MFEVQSVSIGEINLVFFLALYQFQAKGAEQFNCTFACFSFLMHNTRWTKERTEYTRFELRMLPNKYILHHRHVIEEADILKCTGDATPENLIRGQATYRPAGKQNITRCLTVNTSYQVKDCRLSCTIGANNANNLFWPDLELKVLYRCKATKELANIRQFKQRFTGVLIYLFNAHNNLLLLLLNTYFRFKARRFWYHIQRTHLHLFIFSVVQFSPSTRTWNEPF